MVHRLPAPIWSIPEGPPFSWWRENHAELLLKWKAKQSKEGGRGRRKGKAGRGWRRRSKEEGGGRMKTQEAVSRKQGQRTRSMEQGARTKEGGGRRLRTKQNLKQGVRKQIDQRTI